MSNRTIELDDAAYEYMIRWSLREPEIMRRLRERTAKLEWSRMQIAPEQGQFMGLLARMTSASRPPELGAPRFIEVGTFTGYSALAVAHAVPNARVVACDVNEEWTAIAREFWQKAGVGDRIELRLRPALETLAAMLEGGDEGQFDFAFIDADKTNYEAYYEACLRLLRRGGVLTLDNVLWGGSVADPEVQDEDTEALRAISRRVLADDRVDISMVPIGDGLTIAMKR